MTNSPRSKTWTHRLRHAFDLQSLMMYCGLAGIVALGVGTIAFLCVGMDGAKLAYPFQLIMNGAISLTYVIAILVLLQSRFGSRKAASRSTDHDAV